MRTISKWVGGLITGLLLISATGQGVVPALAASTVYVNDSTGNDATITCPQNPGGVDYLTIQDGIDQATSVGSKTVIVCEGDYDAGGFVSLVPGGLTVKSLGEVVVTPVTPYGGPLFQVSQSKNVVFNGLVIDGAANETGAQVFAYFDSSGAITNNVVMHWRKPTPYSTAGQVNTIVTISNNTSLAVKIDKNTFNDISNVGIKVTAPGGVTISNNVIRFHTVWYNGSNFVLTDYNPFGIWLQGTKGAKVLNNIIEGDGNFGNASAKLSRGITLIDSSSNQVNGNTINGTWHGIWMYSDCSAGSQSNSNTISGNKLNENKLALGVGGWGACAGHVDNNKITSNKLFSTNFAGYGINVAVSGSEVTTGNQIKTNTIGGFNVDPLVILAGNTYSGNKILRAPVPGS